MLEILVIMMQPKTYKWSKEAISSKRGSFYKIEELTADWDSEQRDKVVTI